MKISIPITRSSRGNEALTKSEIRNPKSEMVSAFTLIEVAISLAVIGIALVAIIGVLPLGMNVQRENREGTIINQDATVFIEAISKGAQGLDDLTNYVYAITNFWTKFDGGGNVIGSVGNMNGYTYNNSSLAAGWVSSGVCRLTDGFRIVGLLSTPQFTDNNGFPINNLFNVGGYSNHIVAYVRSMSGAASEKPPQDNQIIQQDAFAYRILTVNAAMPGYTPPLWQALSYNKGDQVFYNSVYWEATATTAVGDIPGVSSLWTRNFYSKQLVANLHELRLTFFWPVQPNGKVGTGRQTYRNLIAGRVSHVFTNNVDLYFYQSQSFTNAP